MDLTSGISKRIYIDIARLRKRQPAWTIKTDEGYVVARVLQVGMWRGTHSRDPLFPDGPNCWLETREEWSVPDGAETTVWPVPIRGPKETSINLSRGILKRAHVNKHDLREGRPAWTVRTDEGIVVFGGGELDDGVHAIQSKAALFPRGPKSWIDTDREVVVEAEDREHQAIFPTPIPSNLVPSARHRGTSAADVPAE